jgi:hypothetical protein
MNNKNPWTKEDEREHFPCAVEWWCIEGFFKTVEDDKKWSFNSSITVGSGNNGEAVAGLKTTLFDQKNNKYFIYRNLKFHGQNISTLYNEPNKINEGFYINHDESYMRGLFPDYIIHIMDLKNKILFDFNFQAKSMPQWVAQSITDGWLPWGLGFYRYGFIPKLDVSGKIKIKNKTFNVEGIGYLEHVWGDWSLKNPLYAFSNLKKAIFLYAKLGYWWLHNHTIKIPESITFTSENNPIGYDWVWAVMDNGWTIFYGNIMLWIMKGPAAGILILSKDGENYEDFCDIDFTYKKTKYSKNYDFSYPTELELIARKNKEILHLRFKMTNECKEFFQQFPEGRYWRAFVICEAPGIVDGYYYDGNKKINLKGFCKIEPQRQISKFGHNSLKLDFLSPPKGVGATFNLNSHFLRKNIQAQIQLAPRPKVSFDNFKIDNSNL